MGKTDKIALTPEQERWLVAHFRHTRNDDIMERLGISHSTLHRKARELGLTKTRQFMRKVQREAADKAKASHLRNGTYPPKGYILDERELIAYWTDETRRSVILESRPRRWYRFRPLDQDRKTQM